MSGVIYVGLIIGVNMLFAQWPEYSALWSLIVGAIFVARDFAQRRIGHYVLLAMAAATLATWFMASPFVAIASASAFAVSELADWAVYSVSKRPLRDRILISSAVSVPVDSLIFLGIVGILSPQLFALQVISKMAAAGVAWLTLTKWRTV